jgi:hypothetical protein
MSNSRQAIFIGGLLVLVVVALAVSASLRVSKTGASPANTMSVDATSGGGIDASRVVSGGGNFVIDVDIQHGGTTADNYAGYNLRLRFDDAILAFVPDQDLNSDTTLESWIYTGLGGTVLDSVVSQYDEADSDTLIDTLFGGSARVTGLTSASGAAVNATFRCIANGTGTLHLVSSAERPVQYTTTLGSGGVDLPTNLVDASITCQNVPTPVPTPTSTPTATATPTVTSTPTTTATSTITLTPTETLTPTITPTPTDTPIFSPTPTSTPTATGTPIPSQDPDGDGCVSGEELRISFDPFDPYDFFDVPAPANADPTPNGPRDKTININDVLAVLFYAGANENGPVNGNGVDYDSDKNGDAVKDGRDYDRTSSPPPNPPWNAGPPDGFVSMVDVLMVLSQVGLDCADNDGDGMPNGYENLYPCLDPSVPDANADPDGDGATNITEYISSTDPCDPDTDDDGMYDGYELAHVCLDALVADSAVDSDGDGLINLVEFGLGTDPCSTDTDGDGMSDGYEVANPCLDPLVPDGGADPDADGLSSLTEFNLGTNPCVNDTDGDGCADGEETPIGFNPLNFYDFFDVPVPANQDPTPNGSKDKQIDIGDVLAVLFYSGANENGVPNGNGVDYDSDKDGDTVKDGRTYDRMSSPPPNPPWDAGMPDGAISQIDVGVVLAQVGLDCSGPP